MSGQTVSGGPGPAVVASASPRYRPDVQGLRAVAVVLVILAHAHVAGFAGGFVGVDVFFVISGFVITGVLLSEAADGGRVRFGRFYARRALRILPAATLVLVVTDLAARHVLTFQPAGQVLTDSAWAAVFLANLHFSSVGTNYFATDIQVSPLQHFWSLSVEEQFYLVWPALLAATLFGAGMARRRRRQRPLLRGRVVLLLLVVVGVSLTISVTQTASNPGAAYFDTFARAWELAVGALVAAVLPVIRTLPTPLRAALSWLGMGAILLAAVTYDAGTPFPGTAALLPVLGAAAVIVGGAHEPRRGVNGLLSQQPFRYVGDISYSLYLWHWPLLILAADRAGHAIGGLETAAVVALSVALAAATYAAVENPCRHAARGWAARPRRALGLWPVALSLVLVSAFVARPADPSVQGHGPTVGDETAQEAVRQAVAAGDQDAPVPHVLSPAIGNAVADFKGIGACSAYGRLTSELCNLGDPAGNQAMVVIGDSHATMWIPGLSVVARAAHFRFVPLVKEGCGLYEYVGTANSCSVWYSRFVVPQTARLHPAVIVLPVYNLGDWTVGMRQELADATRTGARVIVLSDAPGLASAPADCLAMKGATLGTCQFPETSRVVRDVGLARALATAAGADFIDVSSWFCASGQCPSVVDGLIPYALAGHVTGTYARFLVPELAASIHLGRPAPASRTAT